ncbi:MAG: hypothetical protein ACK56H_13225, partial [Novosphingobium sp.]
SILIAPCLIVLWAGQARRQNEPSGITKIAIGSLLVALSSLAFAAGSALSPQPGTVPAVWALAGYLGMGVAFMWYWPVLLALVSSNAPARVNSTMMGATFLSLFIGSVGGGWLGSFYDQMSPAAFWTINAAVPAAGGLLALILRGPLQRALQPAT